eukprot:gnl/MRDRNA2_/MRDRNA2_22506_c0_seq1.p1 gnl/MRDRNA2_/MRDRNA2_22506_c0~~gnl/MRDRNA2_/MRDRNA2_22506_c0_seq1.p1  ORF type:complete len:174 (-),score=35.67 gnl/MRDRNA2_/MRDRNA2_22506_c0_seq1:246-767(-)
MQDQHLTSPAQLYAQIVELQKQQGLEFCSIVDPKTAKYSKILDFGCGTCPLAEKLLEMVDDTGVVVGVDPDADCLRVATEQWKDHIDKSRLMLFEASDDRLHQLMADEKFRQVKPFDIIMVNFVLHWIANKELLFENFGKLLSPGGLLLVQSPEFLPPLHRRVIAMMPGARRS